jgi:hypothetical protein
MPDPKVELAFRRAKGRHGAARIELVPLVRQMALQTLADVLPGATTMEAIGALDEDGVPALRIQRVLDSDGATLFDIDEGCSDRAVEDAVDEVDIEYLDVLIGLTGDELMGCVTIS